MEKFIIYVGLNDKDTKKQEISTEKSIDIICKALASQGITDLTMQQRHWNLYTSRRNKNNRNKFNYNNAIYRKSASVKCN